ncbi:hypothetical protein [Futiania mangrovi]|uniref:Uncharacterized protein n=1 Tax=Futiania mangrovi TaxID=2959716 RepID=A0A9J6P7V5_9PROT|nr:hypothetical protein [Futiania mangrovii]MCP1335276.1 hypothetical protein [Futiania mangrovii]
MPAAIAASGTTAVSAPIASASGRTAALTPIQTHGRTNPGACCAPDAR